VNYGLQAVALWAAVTDGLVAVSLAGEHACTRDTYLAVRACAACI